MASATVEQSKPPRQFGKTALMLHGLGVLFLLAGAGTLAALGVEKNESYTFLGFGGAAFGVLTAWAALLLVRSYIAREQSGFAVALVLLLLFEFTLTFALLKVFNYERWLLWFAFRGSRAFLDESFDYCLPALTAALLIVLSLSVSLSHFLTRHADEAHGPARRRNWRRLIFAIAFPIVFLPVLFLYALLTLKLPDGSYRKDRFSVCIARLAPEFVSDAMEQAADGSSRPFWKNVQGGILEYGCASEKRLALRLSRVGTPESNSAWSGMESYYPKQLLDEAIRLGKDKTRFRPTPRFRIITYWIAERATPQRIREILDAGTEYQVEFRRYLLAALGEKNDGGDYSLDILRLAAEEETCRRNVAEFDDLQKFVAAWNSLFARKDWSGRRGLPYVIPYLQQPLTVQLKLVEQCLTDTDVKMRRAAMVSACQKGNFDWSWAITERETTERKMWITAMQKYLDDSDIFVRRCAVRVIAALTNVTLRDTPDDTDSYKDRGLIEANPVSGEDEERETVRAAAKKWLATH